MITKDSKADKVIKKAQKHVDNMLPTGLNESKACFYHARAVAHVLDQMGWDRVLLQAGSASFLADPTSVEPHPSHYSYVFEAGPLEVMRCLEAGHMPEVHVWVAAREYETSEYVIIDTTTKYLPSLSKSMGLPWKAPKPPEYLWALASELPEGWHYVADAKATAMVYQFHSLLPSLG